MMPFVQRCSQNHCHATLNITEGVELPANFPVGLKVLVVDDDYTSLSLAKKLLLRCEYDVSTCSEAVQALLLLREKGGFDLIMADIHILDMDGINLLELFAHHMDLPVIMMSADSRVNNVLKGLMHGATGFLYKPLRMEELQTIWQFVIKKKWLGNKGLGHSATVNDSDGNWQVMGVIESASLSNDAINVPGRPQEKKIDIEEDCDVGEPNSADPPSKKPRLSWSLELHQQFVNAVNQIGIDRAAPKRILDLMNVPGLTREKVASHLQKFRLQLKKLNGMAKHNAELGKFLLCASLDADLAQLGKLDSRTISILKKITPEALAALQDMPEVNHRVQQQDSAKENNCLSSRQDAAFDQSLLNCNGTAVPFPDLPANNTLIMNPANDSNLSTALQHEELNVGLSELCGPVNAQHSYLVAPTQSSSYAQVQEDTCNLNDNFMVVPHQSSETLQPECITPVNLNALVDSYLLSASSDRGNYPSIINHFTMKDFSRSLSGTFGENNPGQNSMIVLTRSLTTAQAENNLLPVNCNLVLNKDSLIKNNSQLSLKPDNLPVRSANAIDEGFTAKSYSLEPDSSSIPLPFHIDGANLQSPHKNIVNLHESLFVPKSCSIRATSIVLGKMIDQGQGRNSDFVGKDEDAPNQDHSESGRML